MNRYLRFSLFRFPLILALTGLFLYSASVQEIHYLFVHHDTDVSDHCDHHLHSKSQHTECSICKLVLSAFVESFNQFEKAKDTFCIDRNQYDLHEAIFQRRFSSVSLRGPPYLA